MTTIALDTSAVVAWIREEPGGSQIESVIVNPDADVVLPGPVLTETIHVLQRLGYTAAADDIAATLASHGLRVEPPQTEDLVRAAALLALKPSAGTVSLADALILAVAERLACPVVTCDRLWGDIARDGDTSAMVVVVRRDGSQ